MLSVHRKLIVGLQCGLQIMSRTKYGVLFVIKMFPTDDGINNQDEVSAVAQKITALADANRSSMKL